MYNQKNILVATGYGGTGSSAVTDLLSEFKGIKSFGDKEIYLLQDDFGIIDLEFHLIINNHRSKTPLAISKFESFIDANRKYYTTFFPNFNTHIDNYLVKIKKVRFRKPLSQFDYQNDKISLTLIKIYFFLDKIIQTLINKKEIIHRLPLKTKYYFPPDKALFDFITKKLLTDLLSDIKEDYLIFDQLIPATSINNYTKYFDNIKVVVVDRDPRDLFLLNKKIWNGASFVSSYKNIDEYINWYKSIRINSDLKEDKSQVLRINFEELIYEYEITKNKIIDFYEIFNLKHKYQFKYFDPKISISNTRLWHKYSDEFKNISLIENELEDFCYYKT
jgi:hypothetical protein